MRHELKCWPELFEAKASGRMDFDVRYDDRGYAVGDTLLLQEWRPWRAAHAGGAGEYTGRELEVEVTSVYRGWDAANPVRLTALPDTDKEPVIMGTRRLETQPLAERAEALAGVTD